MKTEFIEKQNQFNFSTNNTIYTKLAAKFLGHENLKL